MPVLNSQPLSRRGPWRVLTALLVGALALSLCTAAPAGAAVRKAAKITVSVSARELMAGDPVRITGTTTAPARSVVALDRRTSTGRWVTAYQTRTTSKRAYTFAFDPPATTTTYRVASLKTRTTRLARTGTFTVKAFPCVPRPAPDGGSTVLFTKPGPQGVSSTAANISRFICSAATGAKINIAMYFMRYGAGQADSNLIIDSLEAMARFRRVKVRIALEGRLLRPGMSLTSTLSHLRRFATVTVCDQGCHHVGTTAPTQTPAILHDKFMTISDTRWRSYVDPLVMSSSANWSRAQMTAAWQSTMFQWNDRVLASDFNAQFEQLVNCGSSARCTTWNSSRARMGYAAAGYGMTLVDGTWAEPTVERRGTSGRGTLVSFTPQRTSDKLAYALERYTCSPTHRQVRVAHMFITPGRKRVLDALKALKTKGCDVQLVFSQPTLQGQLDGINLAKSMGLTTSCATGVHDKLVMLDGINPAGQWDRTVWSGSQSLGGYALRRNDEQLMRYSTAQASGSAYTQNKLIYSVYLRYWQQIRAVAGACRLSGGPTEAARVGPATAELGRLANSLTTDPNDVQPPQ